MLARQAIEASVEVFGLPSGIVDLIDSLLPGAMVAVVAPALQAA